MRSIHQKYSLAARAEARNASASGAEAEERVEEKKLERSLRRRNFQLISQDSVQRRVAVIDDDEGIRLYLQEVLTQQGFQVSEFAAAEDFLREWDIKSVGGGSLADVVLCDVRLPGLDGLSLVAELKSRAGEVPTILMTAYAEVQSAVRAMREGAYDYLEKPFDTSRLYSVLENAIRFRRLSFENRFLKNMIDPDLKLLGAHCQSPAMRGVYDLVKRVAPAESNILITGEKGVGKEVIARAIHDNSPRHEKPFLVLDCASTPESLLEAELFGHTRDSLGLSHHPGIFERADGGTVFLKEVSELPFALQAKLHRFFQEQKVRAIGESGFRQVDVRVIASTERNLPNEIRDGSFREDLFYKLNVVPVHIPPLRQRKEDIVVLAKHFLDSGTGPGPSIPRNFTPAALSKLVQLPWKGNVAELASVVARCLDSTAGESIDDTDMPVGAVAESEDLFEDMADDLPTLRDMERRYILSVLKKHNGKKDAAAKVLGMSRRTLYRKLTNQDGECEPDLP